MSETESIKTVENCRGHQVPESHKAHLQWWLSQVPTMHTEPMTKEESEFWIMCSVCEASNAPIDEQIKATFLYRVLEKRLPSLGLVATPWLVTLIAGLCSNPVEAVMWAFFLKLRATTNETKLVNIADVAHLFPMGLPTEQAMHLMWDKQKLKDEDFKLLKIDNLLDTIRMT